MTPSPIVCGTDFSDPAGEVAALAARLAHKLDRPLRLVHVLDTRGVMFNQATVLEALQRNAAQRLDDEVARLRALGAEVQARVYEGWPDEGLLRCAQECGAEITVLSAVGARGPARGSLGRTAERVAGRTRAPLLVVREAEPLQQWLAGRRTLKILCGFDTSAASEPAIEWLRRLRQAGPCELVAASVHDPQREAERLGIDQTPAANPDAPEQVRRAVTHSLRDRLQRVLGRDAVRLIVAPFRGSPAARLAELAVEEGADLVVVGSHQRQGLDRALQGSVSTMLMRHSAASVLVVPGALAQRMPAPADTGGRRVLVATDLSPLGNRAARFAFGMLPVGSRVRLVTVQPPRQAVPALVQSAAADALLEQWRHELQALVPAESAARGLSVEIDVIEAEDPAEAIRAAAERIDADLVCMGTTGRTGLSAALLGSVAQAVLRSCRRPVMLVPARDD